MTSLPDIFMFKCKIKYIFFGNKNAFIHSFIILKMICVRFILESSDNIMYGCKIHILSNEFIDYNYYKSMTWWLMIIYRKLWYFAESEEFIFFSRFVLKRIKCGIILFGGSRINVNIFNCHQCVKLVISMWSWIYDTCVSGFIGI